MTRWIAFFIAIVLGVAAGLFYGWQVSPVSYVDTTPDSLRSDFQTDYVLMVAEIYRQEGDLALAARRLGILGADAPAEIVQDALILADQFGYGDVDLALLNTLRQDLLLWTPAAEAP
jgi:hypothetical protein